MEEIHVYLDRTYPNLLAHSLNEMRSSGTLCDVILVCDGEIPAHRVILGAASPYFRGMFSLGLKESKEERIEINCMDGAVLRAVVDFVYSGEISVTENLILPLLEAACMLQLGSLRSVCMNLLRRSATPCSSLEYDNLAGRLGLLDLESFFHRLTIDNFDMVAFGQYKKQWLDASYEAIRALLSHFSIKTVPVNHIMKAVLEWIMHDPSGNREVHSKSLLDELKLQTDVDQEIKDLPGVTPRETLVVLVVGGHSGRTEGRTHTTLKTAECCVADSTTSLPWTLYLPEAPESLRDSGGCQKTGVLDRVIPAMAYYRAYAASAFSDHEMFVIGGEHCSMSVTMEASVECYSIISNTWSHMPGLPLPNPQENPSLSTNLGSRSMCLMGAAAALVEGDLYVCGGRLELVNSSEEETFQSPREKNQPVKILKETWVYNKRSCKWRQCSDMQVARAYHGAATIGGVLYAIGGIGGISTPICLDSVEHFDPWGGVWRSVALLPAPRAYFGCVASKQNIYVMGGHDLEYCKDTVFRYNSISDSWHYIEHPLRTPVDSLSVCSVKNAAKSVKGTQFHSYLIGGQNSYNGLRDVNLYNFKTKRSHCLQPLIQDRIGASAAILRLPPHLH